MGRSGNRNHKYFLGLRTPALGVLQPDKSNDSNLPAQLLKLALSWDFRYTKFQLFKYLDSVAYMLIRLQRYTGQSVSLLLPVLSQHGSI